MLKEMQRGKLNELIQSVHFLNDAKNHHLKDYSRVKQLVHSQKDDIASELTGLKDKFVQMEGPVAALISDQQRENSILNEDIKRQNNMLRTIVEDFVTTVEKPLHATELVSERIWTA